MIYLTLQKDEAETYVGATEVSEAIDSPKAFTTKISQQLRKANLLDSLRGPNGGFCVHKDKKVSLADIVRVIDGDHLLDGCILGFKKCSANRPCAAHFKLENVRDSLKKTLMTTDTEEMKRMIEAGQGYIKD